MYGEASYGAARGRCSAVPYTHKRACVLCTPACVLTLQLR